MQYNNYIYSIIIILMILKGVRICHYQNKQMTSVRNNRYPDNYVLNMRPLQRVNGEDVGGVVDAVIPSHQLSQDQFLVDPVEGNELVVGPHLHHLSLVYDNHLQMMNNQM